MKNEVRCVSQLEYSSTIGILMHLMHCTHPIIIFAVGVLSRFTHASDQVHCDAISRVLKYLGGMKYALSYKSFSATLEGYTDANWITNSNETKSTSGWIFTPNGGTISWGSKKQTVIFTFNHGIWIHNSSNNSKGGRMT